MIHLDFSIVYQMILFLILWVILNKILFHPYLHLLNERELKPPVPNMIRATWNMKARG